MNEEGKVVSNEIFNQPSKCMKSIDGICIDADDNIYVADFSNNAICIITPEAEVRVLAKSPDCDGSNGGLDQPGEPIVRGDQLIVSNFDMVTGEDKLNSGHDDVQNLSVIPLGDEPAETPAKEAAPAEPEEEGSTAGEGTTEETPAAETTEEEPASEEAE